MARRPPPAGPRNLREMFHYTWNWLNKLQSRIDAGGGGTGDVTDAANVGGGAGVFRNKTTSILNFKSLVAGGNIAVTPGTDTVTIAATGVGGGTAQTFTAKVLVETITLAAAGAFDFLTIPTTGERLILEGNVESTVAGTAGNVKLEFNGDTTVANYRKQALGAFNGVINVPGAADNIVANVIGAGAAANLISPIQIEIEGHTDGNFKSAIVTSLDRRAPTTMSTLIVGIASAITAPLNRIRVADTTAGLIGTLSLYVEKAVVVNNGLDGAPGATGPQGIQGIPGTNATPVTVADTAEIDLTITAGQLLSGVIVVDSIGTSKLTPAIRTSLGKADTALQNVVEDLTPQLGGFLDGNQFHMENIKYIEMRGPSVYGTGGLLSSLPKIGMFSNTDHTWDYTVGGFGGPALQMPPAFELSGVQTIRKSMNIVVGGFMLWSRGVLRNDPTIPNLAISGIVGLASQTTYRADSQPATAGSSFTDFVSGPTLDTVNGGVFNASGAVATGFLSQLTLNGAVTLRDRIGVNVGSPTVFNGAVLTNQVGVLIAPLTQAVNNTNQLMGTATIPAGNWNIYQSDETPNHWNGGQEWKSRIITAARTLDATDHYVYCNNTGTITVTLPTAVGCKGREYFIKRVNTALVNINTASGQFLEAVNTNPVHALSTQWQFLRVVSDDAKWLIVAQTSAALVHTHVAADITDFTAALAADRVTTTEKIWGGAQRWKQLTITADRTLNATDHKVYVNGTTLTSLNVTLPTAVGCAGREYEIYNVGVGSTAVRGVNGEPINGIIPFTNSAFYKIYRQYQYIKLMSDGVGWIITGQGPEVATLTTELCLNGNFASGSANWVANAPAYWTFAGGMVTVNNTSGVNQPLYQNTALLLPNRMYRYTFRLTGMTSGAFVPYLTDTVNGSLIGGHRASNGMFFQDFYTGLIPAPNRIIFYVINGTVGSLTDITIKEIV